MASSCPAWLRRRALAAVQRCLENGESVEHSDLIQGSRLQIVKFLTYGNQMETHNGIWALASDPDVTALVLIDKTAVQRFEQEREEKRGKHQAITRLAGGCFVPSFIQPQLMRPAPEICTAAGIPARFSKKAGHHTQEGQADHAVLVFFIPDLAYEGSAGEPPFWTNTSFVWQNKKLCELILHYFNARSSAQSHFDQGQRARNAKDLQNEFRESQMSTGDNQSWSKKQIDHRPPTPPASSASEPGSGGVSGPKDGSRRYAVSGKDDGGSDTEESASDSDDDSSDNSSVTSGEGSVARARKARTKALSKLKMQRLQKRSSTSAVGATGAPAQSSSKGTKTLQKLLGTAEQSDADVQGARGEDRNARKAPQLPASSSPAIRRSSSSVEAGEDDARRKVDFALTKSQREKGSIEQGETPFSQALQQQKRFILTRKAQAKEAEARRSLARASAPAQQQTAHGQAAQGGRSASHPAEATPMRSGPFQKVSEAIFAARSSPDTIESADGLASSAPQPAREQAAAASKHQREESPQRSSSVEIVDLVQTSSGEAQGEGAVITKTSVGLNPVHAHVRDVESTTGFDIELEVTRADSPRDLKGKGKARDAQGDSDGSETASRAGGEARSRAIGLDVAEDKGDMRSRASSSAGSVSSEQIPSRRHIFSAATAVAVANLPRSVHREATSPLHSRSSPIPKPAAVAPYSSPYANLRANLSKPATKPVEDVSRRGQDTAAGPKSVQSSVHSTSKPVEDVSTRGQAPAAVPKSVQASVTSMSKRKIEHVSAPAEQPIAKKSPMARSEPKKKTKKNKAKKATAWRDIEVDPALDERMQSLEEGDSEVAREFRRAMAELFASDGS